MLNRSKWSFVHFPTDLHMHSIEQFIVIVSFLLLCFAYERAEYAQKCTFYIYTYIKRSSIVKAANDDDDDTATFIAISCSNVTQSLNSAMRTELKHIDLG